jgi:mRNA-degrading endonuclease RelE of RelBE toxin-antitoxin system
MPKFDFPKPSIYDSLHWRIYTKRKCLFRKPISSVYDYSSQIRDEYMKSLKSLQPSDRVTIHDIYGNLQETTVIQVTDGYIFVDSLTYITSIDTASSEIWKGKKAKFDGVLGCLFYRQRNSDYRLIPLGFDVKDFEERYEILWAISTVNWELLSTDQLQKTYHFLEELSKQE